MNASHHLRRLAAAAAAAAGLLAGEAALAGTTVIGTTDFADSGQGSSRTYTVPSGANCVTIQAWGAQGYVSASYNLSPGSRISVLLAGENGGNTKVTTSAGTVTTAPCAAGGSAYGVATTADWTTGGPASPDAGSTYPGYVAITADDTLYTLSITESPTSGGTASGAGSYAPDTKVSISESPYAGYSTAGWGGPAAGSVASSSSASTTIVMTADSELIADFTPNTPVFTSGDSTQILTVGQPFSYQVAATQSPVYSAAGLPPGLTISSTGLISGTPTQAGSWNATITASKNAVTVDEVSPGANEIVSISSSSLGNDLSVYASDLNLEIDGAATIGFCIDPWDWSVEGTDMIYNWEPLGAGPKIADGMGPAVATEIEQLWDQYYTPNISDSTAAGLQIAIWELVSAAIGAETSGQYNFSLDSGDSYGASAMIAWVEANPDAPTADLEAVTGGGQDYVTSASVLPTTPIATTTQSLPLTVYAQPVVQGGSATIPAGQAYTYPISATADPTTYNAMGLPAGLSIDCSTGVISGIPTATGTYAVTLSASNPGATGTNTLTLAITAPVPPTYTLSISGSAANGGTFSGAGTYPAGTVVTISETAAPGYRAAGWSGPGAGGVASPSNAATTVTMNADTTLVADFVQQVTLTVAAGSGGTAAGGGTFDLGSTVPIAATPASGYAFSDWSGASPASPGSGSTTITLGADTTVTANFAPEPPSAAIDAAATAYTGSPFTVTSTASAPAGNLTLHSIEWLSPAGDWTVSTVAASGSSSSRSLGITFPTTGTYTLRAGASTDDGNTWVYSPSVQVAVSSGITNYTLETMAVPAGNELTWYAPSPVVQQTYEVQHVNP